MPDPKALEQDFARVANTDSGRNVLRFLMQECGFSNPSVVIGINDEINPLSTIYNEARRNLWLKLRERIPRENLIAIEYGEDIKQ